MQNYGFIGWIRYIETVGNDELIAVNQDAPLVGSAKRIVGSDLTFPRGQGANTPVINWTKTSAPVDVPSATTTEGWEFKDGAAGIGSKLAGQTDIRSGGPDPYQTRGCTEVSELPV